MAITLKQAIELNPMALLSEEEQKRIETEKEIEYYTKIIDEFIARNVHKIMKHPLSFYMESFPQYPIDKKIIELYKDFTILFSRHSQYALIKLAEKEWDWKGYGIKEVEEKREQPKKKSFFLKLFQ